MIAVSELTIYPVKSAAGLALQTSALDRFGLEADRRWLITSPGGYFITQRDEPRLALLQATVMPDLLSLCLGEDTLQVPIPDSEAPERRVQVWEDQVRARDAGGPAARWLSERLGRD